MAFSILKFVSFVVVTFLKIIALESVTFDYC